MAWYPARALAYVKPASVVVSINYLDAFAFEADQLRTEIDRTSFFCFDEMLPGRFDRSSEVGVPARRSHISEFGKRNCRAAFLQPLCDRRRLVKCMLKAETHESTPSPPEIERNEVKTPVKVNRDPSFH